MKRILLPLVAAVLVAAVVGFTSGFLIGISVGLAVVLLGVVIAFTLDKKNSQPKDALPTYDPDTVQSGIEAFFVKVKKNLRPDEKDTETAIYNVLRSALAVLPTSRIKGASEVWDTLQREFLNPTTNDLSGPGSRAEALARINKRCENVPDMLRALAVTLLPDGYIALSSREDATYYLDNLHALPPIQGGADGKALDQLHAGSYFRIGDEIFQVKDRFLYKCGRDVWHEVLGESLRDASIRALEWETEDHELSIILQVSSPLSLEEVGVSVGDLKRMDDDEEGKLTYKGEPFNYDESDKATCTQEGETEAESFYYFDFISPRTQQVLGVERWGTEHKAYIMRPVGVREVEVLRV